MRRAVVIHAVLSPGCVASSLCQEVVVLKLILHAVDPHPTKRKVFRQHIQRRHVEPHSTASAAQSCTGCVRRAGAGRGVTWIPLPVNINVRTVSTERKRARETFAIAYDIVIGERSFVFELLACDCDKRTRSVSICKHCKTFTDFFGTLTNQALLVGGNAFLPSANQNQYSVHCRHMASKSTI